SCASNDSASLLLYLEVRFVSVCTSYFLCCNACWIFFLMVGLSWIKLVMNNTIVSIVNVPAYMRNDFFMSWCFERSPIQMNNNAIIQLMKNNVSNKSITPIIVSNKYE